MPTMTIQTKSDGIRSLPDTVPAENRTLGWWALEWTANYLRQPDGPNAGDPWEYTREQIRIILRWYAIDGNGRFLSRRGVLRRMKGWGKDPFLASIAAIELAGPCRFGGWDDNGYPIAVRHSAPWIQVAAVSRDQTRNTMTLFPGMFNDDAIAEYSIDIGKEIIYAKTDTGGTARLEAVTSSPRALEGGRPSFVIANETHHWLQNNDGLPMFEAIRRNLAKSRDGSARTMEITNAHSPGEGSAAELTYEAWRQGDLDSKDVYYDCLEAPNVPDLKDTDALRAALTAARGDSDWLDVERLMQEIADPVTTVADTQRFYLNRVFVAKFGDWFEDGVFEKCADPSRTIPDGTEVTLGFDGSYSGDSTALVVCTIGEEPHLDVVECWERPITHKGAWKVPITDAEDAIREACKRWKVKEVPCDPYRWARSIEVLQKERIPMVEMPQTPARMVPATTGFYEAVVNGLMTHSGDPRLVRHVGNAFLKNKQLSKITKDSPRKIDLAVAGVIAFSRAVRGKKKTKRVWDMNELISEATDDQG